MNEKMYEVLQRYWGYESFLTLQEETVSSVLEGKDKQLDYAIDYLLDKIKNEPITYPQEPPYPDKSIK